MNKNLGIIDSDKLWELQQFAKAEEDLQAARDYQEAILENCIWAEKGKTIAVSNSIEQWGTPMHYTMLEKLVRKLPLGHRYVFYDFADLKDVSAEIRSRPFKSLYFGSGENKIMISPYGKTMLPEWSCLTKSTEKVRDFSVKKYNRKDFPETTGFDWKTGFKYKDDAALPGWKEIDKCQGENADDPQSRGWRTIFARIVGNFLATPTEVEAVIRTFKADALDPRQSWQNHMGRRNDKLPY